MCRLHDSTSLFNLVTRNGQSWELTPIDFETWEDLLIQGMTRALDLGRDSVLFLDDVGEALSTHFDMTATSATGAADCLLRHLAFLVDDITQVPKHLLEFVNESLRCTYPPAPNARTPCFWVQRTLTGLVEKCPQACIEDFLASLQEGLTTWFADEHSAFQGEDYDDVSIHATERFVLSHGPARSCVSMNTRYSECDSSQRPLKRSIHSCRYWTRSFATKSKNH